MYCYKCGKVIRDDATFCNHCGAKVSTPNDVSNEVTNDSGKSTISKKSVQRRLIFALAVGTAVVLIALVIWFWKSNDNIQSNNSATDSVAGNTPELPQEVGEFAEEDNPYEDYDSEVAIDDIVYPESENEEAISIEPIHMSTDNMRPTIIENDGISIRTSSFTTENAGDVFIINFLVENNTDREIDINLSNVTINGFDIFASGYIGVEPGHKANCDVCIWQDDIDETGESEWDVIEGTIEVIDWNEDEVLHSIPVIVDKECWEYEEEYAENNPITPVISSDLNEIPDGAIVISSDNLYPDIYEQDGISASVNSYEYGNGETVFLINFMVENNTSEDISIGLTDVVIDGYDIPAINGIIPVETGHKAVCDSSVWLRDMRKVGIEDWVVLEGNIQIRDGYWENVIYSAPIVIYREAWETAA